MESIPPPYSGKKVVIFNHDYCPDENGFVVKYGGSKLDLRQRGLIAWVFGHWHYSYLNDNDVMYIAHVERIIDGSVSALK